MLSSKIQELQQVQALQEKSIDGQALHSCVIKYATSAGICAVAAGIIPGFGAAIAAIIGILANWLMYIKMAKIAGVKIGFKVIASAVIANIIGNLIAFPLSFIPVANCILDGIIIFGILWIAANIFISFLISIFRAKQTS